MKLNKNIKPRWEEFFAKIILEKCFPAEFNNIIIDDKPDLQMGDIGIEATVSILKSELEMDNLSDMYHNILAKDNNSIKEKNKKWKRIQELGGIIDNYSLTLPMVYVDTGRILNSIKIKEEKLNSCIYKKFKHYYLFIRDIEYIEESKVNEVQEKIYNIIDKYSKKFEKIIVYLNGVIYSFNYIERNYKKTILSLEQREKYVAETNKMLKNASK